MKTETASKQSGRSLDALILAFLLALCFALYFWNLGDLPFHNRGEPREGMVVEAMVSTGDLILPNINGEYIPFKPPLFHWVAVLVAKLAGRVDEFVLRFPSALFGTLGVLMTYFFAVRLWNRRSGVIAAVVLATSIEWWQAATITQVDMILAFFISAALMVFYLAYLEERFRTPRLLLLAALLALGTLTKGPLGVAVPSFVILVFLSIRRDWGFLKKLPLVSGAAVFLLVAGSWYGLAYLQGGWDFFKRQIIDETLLTGVGSYGRHQPVYYFIPVMFYNMLPWSFFFPGLAVFLYQRRRRLAHDHLLYPLVWVVAVFVFFSMALGKRGIYILPLYPAAALLFGAWWNAIEEGVAGSVKLTRWVGLVYAISGFIALAATTVFITQELGGLGLRHLFSVPAKLAKLDAALSFVASPWLTLASLGILAVLLFLVLLFLTKKKWAGVFGCLLVIALTQAFFMKNVYLPYVAAQRTMKSFMARVTRRVDIRSPLVFYRAFDYGTIFYAHRNIHSYATKFSELKRPYFLLMWEEDVKRLSTINRFKILDISEGREAGERHRLVLVEPEQDVPIVDPTGYGE
jgi:4-amino-4-deoxy-L-arabinose transferase-like glycosyltransferase